jgi:hypothetical protein
LAIYPKKGIASFPIPLGLSMKPLTYIDWPPTKDVSNPLSTVIYEYGFSKHILVLPIIDFVFCYAHFGSVVDARFVFVIGIGSLTDSKCAYQDTKSIMGSTKMSLGVCRHILDRQTGSQGKKKQAV